MLLNFLIRSFMSGCVEKALATFLAENGFAINNGATALLTFNSPLLWFLIFSNADAKPSGYLVRKAPLESAKYSLFLEIAS